MAGLRAHAAARRRAGSVQCDVRTDAGRDDRRPDLRALGGYTAGRRADAARRRNPHCTVPRFRRGRTDVGDHFTIDAALRREERDARQRRILEHERRHRPRPAFRRQRSGRHRAPAVDRNALAPTLKAAFGRLRRHRPEGDPGAGAADGRRGAQPQRGGDATVPRHDPPSRLPTATETGDRSAKRCASSQATRSSS